MNELRKTLRKLSLFKFLSSIKITCSCLFILFVLTFWGTVSQVNHDLYASQERFFHSWFFLASDFIPFPGARLVLWILAINLLAVSITRFVYTKRQLGITIIHFGLILYFLAAFATFHLTKESNVYVKEGAETNLSASYAEWEISIWSENQTDNNYRTVTGIDVNSLSDNPHINLETFKLSLHLEKLYPHAQAYTAAPSPEKDIYINDSGIRSLVQAPPKKDRQENVPGIIVKVLDQEGNRYPLILYGIEDTPTQLQLKDQLISLQLRRKRSELPFKIKLIDITRELHPGTETAKRYESLVEVTHQDLSREERIYMNHPLRFKDFTLYQASYAIDKKGEEYSTFAVVRNAGRLLPYVASLLTFGGLIIHFIQSLFKYRKRHKGLAS